MSVPTLTAAAAAFMSNQSRYWQKKNLTDDNLKLSPCLFFTLAHSFGMRTKFIKLML